MKPIEETSRRVGRKMLLISGIGMEGTMSFQLMGFNRFLTSLYREPSFVEKVLDMVLEFAIELGRKMASAGVDAIWLGDDYAGIKGLFLSPDMMRRYVFPRLRRIVTALKREGVYVIKHTDGDVSLILKDLIDAGIDAINPIQPECMDIQEVKQKYGDKVCLWGNISCGNVLQRGTSEEVLQAVKSCIVNASPGGGHILSSSHSLHTGVKVENVLTMVKAARRYGKYPVKS
jgi:uroporphyrinogen decarboxylase